MPIIHFEICRVGYKNCPHLSQIIKYFVEYKMQIYKYYYALWKIFPFIHYFQHFLKVNTLKRTHFFLCVAKIWLFSILFTYCRFLIILSLHYLISFKQNWYITDWKKKYLNFRPIWKYTYRRKNYFTKYVKVGKMFLALFVWIKILTENI